MSNSSILINLENPDDASISVYNFNTSLSWLLGEVDIDTSYFYSPIILINLLVIRASVPRLNLDDVFEQKNEIAKAVEDELEKVMHFDLDPRKACSFIMSCEKDPDLFCFLNTYHVQAMSAYGFEIVQTLITDIEPDEHVKRAMNEINAGKFSHLMSLLFPVC